MKSKYEMSQAYESQFEDYLLNTRVANHIRPKQFIHILKIHKNMTNFMEIDNMKHIDLRNPLIAVLGDSVSAGHFEANDITKLDIVQNINDSYVEKFRNLLSKQFPLALINIVNSAIAGDNIKNMNKRLTRDVIAHQPDLVIINATLNWSKNRGTLQDYQFYYENIVQRILRETKAEIVLLTPNQSIDQSLYDRVNIVRHIADKYQLSCVDIYQMWEDVVVEKDLITTLSNQDNHPTPLGHTFIAKAIMQLFKEDI